MISTRNLGIFVPHTKYESRKIEEKKKEGEEESLQFYTKDLEIMSQTPASPLQIMSSP